MTNRVALNTAPRYLRAAGACEYLQIARSTLWHWCKVRADFPKPIKAGPRVTLFDVAAIEKFLSSINA